MKLEVNAASYAHLEVLETSRNFGNRIFMLFFLKKIKTKQTNKKTPDSRLQSS